MDVSIHLFVYLSILVITFIPLILFIIIKLQSLLIRLFICIIYQLPIVYCFFIFCYHLFVHLFINCYYVFSFILSIYLFLNSTKDCWFFFSARVTATRIMHIYLFCTLHDIPYLISILLFMYNQLILISKYYSNF